MKGNACRRVGMDSLKIELPQSTTTEQLLAEIEKLNANPDVHGILLQHPVPEQIDERACFDAINLNKDVDGVTCLGFGRMSMGEPAYGSATPQGIMTILKEYGIEIGGKHAVVVGRSAILGKPMAMMLLAANATVTICHSRTQNLPELVKQADIVVGAVGKAELIGKLNEQMGAMQARLPNAFGRLPKAKVEIKRVPPEIEAGAPMGYYNSPSLDGTRPGIYWINLKDTAEWPSWTLPTLTYHEASPGHHLQIALQQESPSAPKLMNLFFFSAYGEGWGLYAEQLADELGAYQDDPAGQIGYLQSLMFRAARLVVDTGIHAKGWSREEGIRYMMTAYGDTEGAATSEVERYCGWPGQACAYKVGHNEWVRLRDKARSRLGARFDQRGFHDTALAAGGVPLSVLERIVDGWTASQA